MYSEKLIFRATSERACLPSVVVLSFSYLGRTHFVQLNGIYICIGSVQSNRTQLRECECRTTFLKCLKNLSQTFTIFTTKYTLKGIGGGGGGGVDIQDGSFFNIYYQDTRSLFRAIRTSSSKKNYRHKCTERGGDLCIT